MLQRFLRRYAQGEAAVVAPHVIGRRVLDLGAGEGYVAAALRRHTAVWTCAADVGAFAREAGPYIVYDGARLPFANAAFDTTLILFTLHHCITPAAVLDEAIRVTRSRLLVLESVYRNRLDRFWLDLLDRRLNHFRHGGRMSVPLAFRTPEGWRALFTSHGLVTVTTQWLGSRWEVLVHHPLLYVLDVPDTEWTAGGTASQERASSDGSIGSPPCKMSRERPRPDATEPSSGGV